MSLNKILGYNIPKTRTALYLGNLTQDIIQKEDKYLIKALLAASKKAVIRSWYKVDPLTKQQWLCIVEEIFVMGKLIYVLRLQETQFNEIWEKQTDYRAQRDDITNSTGQ